MSLLVPSRVATKSQDGPATCNSSHGRKGKFAKVMQSFSRVHRNIPDIQLAAMIVAFQCNMRNHRIRSKMNVRLPKTVKELYTLVDKCARVEEGRKLPREEDGINIDSQDDDEATSQ